MSVSYSTNVVVGFDANDAIKIHKETICQTKYNENTGIPYPVEIKTEKKYFGGIEITEEASLEDCVSRLTPSLEMYQADACEEGGKVIIGISIEALDTPCVRELQITQIESIRKQVKAAMSNLGLNAEPALFVVFNCSY